MSNNLDFIPVEDVGYKDTLIDAFGRLRVSNPFTRFESKQVYSSSPLHYDTKVTGTGLVTYNTNKSSSTLSLNGTGSAIRQTKRSFVYQAGKSLLVYSTFTMGPHVSGVTKRVGYFDANNGVFLESDGITLNWVIRSSTSGAPIDGEHISQVNWNIDKFDGNGPSGITLDITKSQITFIDLEWLGVGRVRVGFVINGRLYEAHQFLHANILAGVYMSNPNLPLRTEISGTGVASIEKICAVVIGEGAADIATYDLGIDNATAPLATADLLLHPAIAIRLQTGKQGATFEITDFNILAVSTSTFRWAIILNPTFNNALTFNSITNSVVQVATNALNANTVSGGTLLKSGFSSQGKGASFGTSIETFQLPGYTIDGVSDIVCLAIQTVVGNNETYYASISWNEIY